jgi:hypothetical protein
VANPKHTVCECESSDCKHHNGEWCQRQDTLADYYVAGCRQTLCPECANHAHTFCKAEGYPFSIIEGKHAKDCDCGECEPEPVDAEERFDHA